MISQIAARYIICLLLQAFYKQLNIPSSLDNITNVTPSTFQNILQENSAKMLIIIREKYKKSPIFLSCDVANKKGIHHMVKVIRFQDFSTDELFLYELDLDGCISRNFKTANAINYLIIKVHPIESNKKSLMDQIQIQIVVVLGQVQQQNLLLFTESRQTSSKLFLSTL